MDGGGVSVVAGLVSASQKPSLLARRLEFRLVATTTSKSQSANGQGQENKTARYMPDTGNNNSNSNNNNIINNYHSKTLTAPSQASPDRSSSPSSTIGMPIIPGGFPRIDVKVSWPALLALSVGPGLQNLGNTCFLNSTLQCLTYTPPLALYLINRIHSKTCRQVSPCMFCELEIHVTRCFSSHRESRAISPKTIVGRLKFVAKHLRVGRQEDAHEFLRYFVDSLQNSCLAGSKKLNHKQKETTPVYQIFGGNLQSQVVCTVCKNPSTREDPLLDISLEIKNSNSVHKALSQFTREEVLQGDNKYKCSSCNKLVVAKKRMTILNPPAILVLQLKRFDYTYSTQGTKLSKPIQFSSELDIQPFMFNAKEKKLYDLYGVLVHAGHSCHSGHYYSYIKAPNGIWYQMNDTEVRQVSVNTVLNQHQAYILFYAAQSQSKPHTSNPPSKSQKQQIPLEPKAGQINNLSSINKHISSSGATFSTLGTSPPKKKKKKSIPFSGHSLHHTIMNLDTSTDEPCATATSTSDKSTTYASFGNVPLEKGISSQEQQTTPPRSPASAITTTAAIHETSCNSTPNNHTSIETGLKTQKTVTTTAATVSPNSSDSPILFKSTDPWKVTKVGDTPLSLANSAGTAAVSGGVKNRIHSAVAAWKILTKTEVRGQQPPPPQQQQQKRNSFAGVEHIATEVKSWDDHPEIGKLLLARDQMANNLPKLKRPSALEMDYERGKKKKRKLQMDARHY